MRNKKLFAVTATCMLSASVLFAGCGSKNNNASTSSSSSSTTASTSSSSVSSSASTSTSTSTDSAAAGTAVDGTYTASSKGMESDVSVTITVKDGAISECTIDASKETEGIGSKVPDTMQSQVVENNGQNIDAVTGATVTSTAAITALDDCMSQAGLK